MALLFIWTKPPEFCSAIITDADDDPPRRREFRNCEKDRAFSATSATCPGNSSDLESDDREAILRESGLETLSKGFFYF